MKICLYLIMTFCFQNSLFAENILNAKSIYHLDQQWITQDNKKMNLKQLIGKPLIVSMIFTSCPGACPLIVSDMKSFDRQLSVDEKAKIRFAAFSIDPVHDTPETLTKFYKKMKLDKRWTLFTSNANQVRELAAVFGFGYKDIGDGNYTHSSTLFLLSSDGEILARKERNSDWKEFLEKFRSDIRNR